jgi:integrase
MFDEYEPALAWAEAVVSAVNAGTSPPEPLSSVNGDVNARFTREQLLRTSLVDAARIWHEHVYLTRGDANAERADAVWANLMKHAIPYLHGVGVVDVQDVRASHVENLSVWLAGRASSSSSPSMDVAALTTQTTPGPGPSPSCGGSLLSARDLSELSKSDPELRDVSVSTVYGAVRGGRLTPAGADRRGQLFTRADAERAGVLRRTGRGPGLSEQFARDILRTLRNVLDYARAHGAVGVLVFEDLIWRPTKRFGKDAARPTRARNVPESWEDLRRIAELMSVVQQFTMWLLALTGVRLGEAFGFQVRDWLDAHDPLWPFPPEPGVGGLLVLERQGGRLFRFLDEFTGERIQGETKDPKTPQSVRVIVVPEPLAALIQTIVRAVHTDPVTGEPEMEARLVPVLNCATGGQATFSSALTTAVRRAELPGLTPHSLRRRLVSDLHDLGTLPDWVPRRMMGHQAGTDVHATRYQRDTPELKQMRLAATEITRLIGEHLPDGLMVPTTRRNKLHKDEADVDRWAVNDVRLQEVGWLVTELEQEGRATVGQVAALTGAGQTTIRRHCADGVIKSETVERDGKRIHLIPSVEVARLMDEADARVTLGELAETLNVPYHRLWTMSRDIPGIVKQGRELVISPQARDELVVRAQRDLEVRERSLSVNEIAIRLGCDRQVAARLARRRYEPDPDVPGRYLLESVIAWHARRVPRTSFSPVINVG